MTLSWVSINVNFIKVSAITTDLKRSINIGTCGDALDGVLDLKQH